MGVQLTIFFIYLISSLHFFGLIWAIEQAWDISYNFHKIWQNLVDEVIMNPSFLDPRYIVEDLVGAWTNSNNKSVSM